MSYQKRFTAVRRATASLTATLLKPDKASNNRVQEFAHYVNNGGVGDMNLAKNLACLVDESSHVDEKRPVSRMERKRSIELRIKKRVKEQYRNGKFRELMANVIATPGTLQDAYDCIRLNSDVDIAQTDRKKTCFGSIAEELIRGGFDVNAHTFSIATKTVRKDVLVLPDVDLKVVQEAIRIVLEVVYKPHFSKISHGYRSGRGHSTALKYIRKETAGSDWWFTLLLNKKLDACILAKMISVMEDKIEDPGLYAIIQSMFRANVLNFEFGGFPKGHGLPQEGVLSPILMNIYLDLFDREFYRLSMKYEALVPGFQTDKQSKSKLRSWFRRNLKGHDLGCASEVRVHACRFMDEILFSVAGSKDAALSFKYEVLSYLKNCLHLEIDNETELFPCQMSQGIRFLGTLIKKNLKESPATRSVHKLKEKVAMFGLQKQEAWDSGTVSIGKKWLGYGLKKVKESEIKHLADSTSVLSQISHLRKSGMETDHWFKYLLKIWMQDVNSKAAESEEAILSRYISEPALPEELIDSFYEFQRQVEKYVSLETASTLALLPNSGSSTDSVVVTEIVAPILAIKKRLQRYGLITRDGYPRAASLLVLQDNLQIINWFAGIVNRWLRWYAKCDNFNEVKLLVCDLVRKSCIRTLASKHRVHEADIEKRFDTELNSIPSTLEVEQEMVNGALDPQAFESNEALMYGISYSGLCLLSLARMVSHSRPCSCFVIGCTAPAPSVYTLHVMERQKFPGWKTGFSSCIHPSLNRRRIALCKQHLTNLYLGHISLQSINFGAWK